MSAKPSLLAELKRRNVFRAAALYVSAVWVLIQVITQVGPVVSLPTWVTRWCLVAAAIGFPFWIAFAWAFELTPAGVKREGEVVVDAATARRTARKLDHWTFGVLALAVVLLLTDRFVVRGAAADADAAVTEQSVAVLPLANESGDSANDYFVDGLSEQLISDLSRLESLRVIGRTSSFRFRGSKESLASIASQLGVAHLVEGTVRQSGDRVKVVVGLVRAADGSSVWSQSYDREMKDIFAVQADVAQSVAAALQVKLQGAPRTSGEMPPSGNTEAYQAVLQARGMCRQGSPSASRQGIGYAEKAISLDPDYADAYATLAVCWIRIGLGLDGRRGIEEERQAFAEARRAADRALALAPELPAAHVARGRVLRYLDLDQMSALAEFRRALALAPGDAFSMFNLGSQLGIIGDHQQSIEMLRRAISADPLNFDAYDNLIGPLKTLGRLDEAEQVVQSALALQPGLKWSHGELSDIAILRGDAAAAVRHAEQVTGPEAREWALAAARQVAGDPKAADAALETIIARYGMTSPYEVAAMYALRRQPDAMFEWLDRAWTERDWTLVRLLSAPFILHYRHDPRFAALCRKMGLPVPGAE